ncbi:hypothetical protein IQ07DRAFT_596474 [Pyrenochaeta sp. DS3sAY3a]|nr:hypothetical protein IQ07DRAFT_596474 [Pyrenochaeta sp. DS3sAY3a]
MPISALEADFKLYLDNRSNKVGSCKDNRKNCGQNVYSLACKTTDEEIKTALQSFSKAYESQSNKPSAERKSQARVQEIYTDMCHGTMKRINSQPPEIRKLVKRALSWILRSPHSLTMPELETVLGFPYELDHMRSNKNIDPKRFKGVLIACAGLIKEEEQLVRLSHYTTQQYLDDHISAINTTANQETGT